MLNPFRDVNWNPDSAGRRAFGRSWIVGFPIVGLLVLIVNWWRIGEWLLGVPVAIAGVGVVAGTVFFLLPALARPFYVVWYGLACAIGFVVGNVFLVTVFYVIVTGTGWVLRLFGRRPLDTTLDRARASYWHDAGPSPAPERYLRQF
jgi:hypothetical protein